MVFFNRAARGIRVASEEPRCVMARTVEAVIDEQGNVRLLESIHLPTSCRALVMILDDAPPITVNETTLLSERALAEDWNRPEEDKAWSYLQPVR